MMPSHGAHPSRRRRRSSIRSQALGSFLLVFGALNPPAHAAPEDRCQAMPSCRQQTVVATQRASQNRYDEAMALYEKAYAQSKEPRLLLNIGRCFYRMGQPRQALARYEEFRRLQPDPEPALLGRMNQFIAEAKLAILAAEEGKEKEAPKPPEPVEFEPPPAPLKPQWDGKTVFGRPLWRVGVGFGAMAVGGVLIGLGGGALSVNGRCVDDSVSFTGKCATQTGADGTRTAAIVDGITPGVPMLVTGIVLFVGGITLIAVPSRTPKSARLAPTFSRAANAWSFAIP